MNIKLIYDTTIFNFDAIPTRTIDYLKDIVSKILKIRKNDFELHYGLKIISKLNSDVLLQDILFPELSVHEILVKKLAPDPNEEILALKNKLYIETSDKLLSLKDKFKPLYEKIISSLNEENILNKNYDFSLKKIIKHYLELKKISLNLDENLNNENDLNELNNLKEKLSNFKIIEVDNNCKAQIKILEKQIEDLNIYIDNITLRKDFQSFIIKFLEDKMRSLIDFNMKISGLLKFKNDYKLFVDKVNKFLERKNEEILLNESMNDSVNSLSINNNKIITNNLFDKLESLSCISNNFDNKNNNNLLQSKNKLTQKFNITGCKYKPNPLYKKLQTLTLGDMGFKNTNYSPNVEGNTNKNSPIKRSKTNLVCDLNKTNSINNNNLGMIDKNTVSQFDKTSETLTLNGKKNMFKPIFVKNKSNAHKDLESGGGQRRKTLINNLKLDLLGDDERKNYNFNCNNYSTVMKSQVYDNNELPRIYGNDKVTKGDNTLMHCGDRQNSIGIYGQQIMDDNFEGKKYDKKEMSTLQFNPNSLKRRTLFSMDYNNYFSPLIKSNEVNDLNGECNLDNIENIDNIESYFLNENDLLSTVSKTKKVKRRLRYRKPSLINARIKMLNRVLKKDEHNEEEVEKSDIEDDKGNEKNEEIINDSKKSIQNNSKINKGILKNSQQMPTSRSKNRNKINLNSDNQLMQFNQNSKSQNNRLNKLCVNKNKLNLKNKQKINQNLDSSDENDNNKSGNLHSSKENIMNINQNNSGKDEREKDALHLKFTNTNTDNLSNSNLQPLVYTVSNEQFRIEHEIKKAKSKLKKDKKYDFII